MITHHKNTCPSSAHVPIQLGPGYMPAAIGKLRLEVSWQVARGLWQRPALMSWAINVSKWAHCCKAAMLYRKKMRGNWQQVEVFPFLLEAGCRICNTCVPIFSMRFLHEAIQLSWRSRGDLNIFGLSGSNGWFGPDGYSSFLAAPGRCSDSCLRILRQLQ